MRMIQDNLHGVLPDQVKGLIRSKCTAPQSSKTAINKVFSTSRGTKSMSIKVIKNGVPPYSQKMEIL